VVLDVVGSNPTSRPRLNFLNPWKLLDSRVPYENRWIRLREDSVLRPDGRPGIYGVIELRPSVAIVALNERKEIVLVGQWRYPTDRYSWEVPRGGSNEGESDLLGAARRELLEETGVEADDWTELGDLDLCNGVLRAEERLYLATSLRRGASRADPEESIETRWVPLEEAVGMVMRNEIREATSAAAILRVALMLSHS
jgi:8-oxo-dGTP pyrophosphatase MutT (NUDIX family)